MKSTKIALTFIYLTHSQNQIEAKISSSFDNNKRERNKVQNQSKLHVHPS